MRDVHEETVVGVFKVFYFLDDFLHAGQGLISIMELCTNQQVDRWRDRRDIFAWFENGCFNSLLSAGAVWFTACFSSFFILPFYKSVHTYIYTHSFNSRFNINRTRSGFVSTLGNPRECYRI